MHILYYSWNENTALDIEETFNAEHISYQKIQVPFRDYEEDSDCISEIKNILSDGKFDLIFSFNYFPFLSTIALDAGIRYACWVYDCPNLTLYSKTVTNSCNYIFLFDRQMCQDIQAIGAQHVYHLPLAVNTSRLSAYSGSTRSNTEQRIDYQHDVCFIGSLYEHNMFDQVQYLPDHLLGFLHGILNSQQKIWGYNFIGELLSDEIIAKMEPFIILQKDERYLFTPKQIYTNMLNQKITSMDRIELLNQLASRFPVALYSASDTSLCPDCHACGTVSYSDKMPAVFHTSKINLNISLRSITSGIPLRCMDILGAGGFLLSNFQPELAEFFIPGEDFMFFESDADLMEKVDYYLSHDKEREEIAANGLQKVTEQFSYQTQFHKILEVLA